MMPSVIDSNSFTHSLTETRLQLHYAIQLIAAAGAALATPQPDYSHTSLRWNPDLKYFVGALIPAEQPFRVALDPIQLNSLLLDASGTTIATFPLNQRTLNEGLVWLQQAIASRGADAKKVVLLSYPPDDFPDHAIAHGAAFDASRDEERQQLVSYYHETYSLLNAIATQHPGASPVCIWPHHFDMATLVSLSGEKNGEPLSIGVGFSPGDSSYAQPYWYVTPYPYPDTADLPHLDGGGFWHTERWVGAVLTAAQLESADSLDVLNQFLQSAYSASEWLLR